MRSNHEMVKKTTQTFYQESLTATAALIYYELEDII